MPSGSLRIGQSRVLLELVGRACQDGVAPETIMQRYETLRLADVYAEIASYLRHRHEIERYMEQREREALEVRLRMQAEYADPALVSDRLLARLADTTGSSPVGLGVPS
jgi:uncharacterized protein (DUF433 family)